jgi:peptidoglycan-associated lipoprotein
MKTMNANIARVLFLLSCVAFAAACGPKPAGDESGTPTAPSVQENTLGDSDSGRAEGLQTINFPYDSFMMDETAKSIAKANADILKDKTSLRVQVEGHCDQRGGIQYNIALGEKRANAVKNYLEGLGVGADRLTTISYGKERPIDPGTGEDAYAKNRRANFAITSR